MDGRRVDLRGAPFGLRPIECVLREGMGDCTERPVCRSASVEERPFSVSFFIIPYFQEIVKKKTCFSAQVVIK